VDPAVRSRWTLVTWSCRRRRGSRASDSGGNASVKVSIMLSGGRVEYGDVLVSLPSSVVSARAPSYFGTPPWSCHSHRHLHASSRL